MEREKYSIMCDRGENWLSLLLQDDEHTQVVELLRCAVEQNTEKLKKYLEKWIYENIELVAYYPSSDNSKPDGFIEIGSITDGVLGYVDNYEPPREYNDPRPRLYYCKTSIDWSCILSEHSVEELIKSDPTIRDNYIKAINGVLLYFENELPLNSDLETIKIYFPKLPKIIQQLIISRCNKGDLYAMETLYNSGNIYEYKNRSKRVVAELTKLLDAVKEKIPQARQLPPKLDNEEARKAFEMVTYCQRDNELYIWTGTSSLFGYFVDKASDKLGVRPSNDRIPWKIFQQAFQCSDTDIATAKQAVNDYKNKGISEPEGFLEIKKSLNY